MSAVHAFDPNFAPGDAPLGSAAEPVDVLIVGAGLSGIGAAAHLKRRCPWASFAIWEAREEVGGTWDLFRYPGVRSDSDMFTLGYGFRPWTQAKAIADGPSILHYLRETSAAHGIDAQIQFGHRVKKASWDSARALWRVEGEQDGIGVVVECRFLLMCAGYYSYAEGHAPKFSGMERFPGRIVHPQSWPTDLDYRGKTVLVVGSGATAVTIVPEMAKTAAHVTMLQRSPTYMVSRPSHDPIADALRARLPAKLAYGLTRLKNVALNMYFYRLMRRRPERAKAGLIALARKELGPDCDVATHFTPRYAPWDQRLCLVPDSDFFVAVREKRASVVTDQIETFTETGVRTLSGIDLPADVIVMATGLKLNLMGDVGFDIDGVRIDFAKTFAYKGAMYGGVPNLASVFGYANASWTLKADLVSTYVCRLLNHMRRKGYSTATPRPDPALEPRPFLELTSGYVKRATAMLPKQGTRKPWRVNQNYALDLRTLRFGRIADGVMEFAKLK